MKVKLFAIVGFAISWALLTLFSLGQILPMTTGIAQAREAFFMAPNLNESRAKKGGVISEFLPNIQESHRLGPNRINRTGGNIDARKTFLKNGALMFVENMGQFESKVRFQVVGGNMTLQLMDDGFWFTFLGQPKGPESDFGAEETKFNQTFGLKVVFVDANPDPDLHPFTPLSTAISYFKGQNPAQWQLNVPVWGGVRYKDLYPGIDLELVEQQGRLMQRLIVQPGANLAQVKLRITGADDLTIKGDQMVVQIGQTQFSFPLLQVVHNDGTSVDLEASQPLLNGVEVIAPFASQVTPASTIQAIPGLLYSTFLGGSAADAGYAIVTNAAGNAYVTGQTTLVNFPVISDTLNSTTDLFIAKVEADGSGLAYALFLGGSADELGTDITLDEAGDVYVTGWTNSADFPVKNGFDSVDNGGGDVLVIKVDGQNGTVDYAQLLGGTKRDEGEAIAVHNGQTYITGWTLSSDFPMAGLPFDSQFNNLDAFVAVITGTVTETGSALRYSTFLGGRSEETGHDIAVDEMGAIYVVGQTFSSDFFPTRPNSFDQFLDGGDGFIIKLLIDQMTFAYGAFLGGDAIDNTTAIALDQAGNAYVTGSTQSPDFPTKTSALTAPLFDTSHNGFEDAFVAKLTPTLSNGADLVYATFLGGSNDDIGSDIAVDGAGNAYVIGSTFSTDLPTIPEISWLTDYEGAGDGFMAKVNSEGTGAYISFWGGQQADFGQAIALDGLQNIYLTGETLSTDFFTSTNAFKGGDSDAFVTKFDPITPTTTGEDVYLIGQAVSGAPSGGVGSIRIWYGNLGSTPVASMTLQAILDSNLTYQSDTSGVMPNQTGNILAWELPGAAYLDGETFTLLAQIPHTMVKVSYPITLTLMANGTAGPPGPTQNETQVNIRLIGPLYLPLVIKAG